MKLLGAIIGACIAWALNKWLPGVLASFVEAPTLFTGVSAIAGGLTSLWVVALGRLSSFEKLEDLTGDQKSIAIAKAKQFRRAIIFSVAFNTVIWVLTVLLIVMNPTLQNYFPHAMGYWLLLALGSWGGGFAQSIRCIDNIEASRLAIAATQDAEKRRGAYLKKMREDEAKTPVNRDDPHLRGYTDSIPNPG